MKNTVCYSGGFGGCTVSMVRRDAVEDLKKEIKVSGEERGMP